MSIAFRLPSFWSRDSFLWPKVVQPFRVTGIHTTKNPGPRNSATCHDLGNNASNTTACFGRNPRISRCLLRELGVGSRIIGLQIPTPQNTSRVWRNAKRAKSAHLATLAVRAQHLSDEEQLLLKLLGLRQHPQDTFLRLHDLQRRHALVRTAGFQNQGQKLAHQKSTPQTPWWTFSGIFRHMFT